MVERGEPNSLVFKSYAQRAYMDDQFKLYSADDGKTYELYDLLNDPGETTNVVTQYPAKMKAMRVALDRWIISCENSAKGKDYVGRE